MKFLIPTDFSKYCAKASVFDVCLVPFEANKKEQIRGVSFHFKATLSKNGRVLNAGRITRIREKCRKTEQHTEAF